MALTQRTEYDHITLLLDGQMAIRRARVVFDDDGVTEIARTFHRQVLVPGQDVSGLPNRIQALCDFVWTPQVIAAYEAAKVANRS